MSTFATTINGAAGRAERLDHMASEPWIVDRWVLTLNEPRVLSATTQQVLLASQFLIVVDAFDRRPIEPGPDPHDGMSHRLAFGPLQRTYVPGEAEPEGLGSLAIIPFSVLDDPMARLVGQAVAGSAVRGRLPIGGRFCTAMWTGGVNVAAAALVDRRINVIPIIGGVA